MSEGVKYLFYVSLSMFMYMLVIPRFWGCFLEKKNPSPASFFSWLLLFLSQIWTQYAQQHGFSIRSTWIITVCLLLIVLCGYKTIGWETYLLFALFCAVLALIERTLYSFFILLGKDYNSTRPVATVLSSILMITFSYIVSFLRDEKYKEPIPLRFTLVLLLIPIISIYIIFAQYFAGNSHFLSVSVFIVLLLFNIFTFDVYTKLSRYFLREKENAVHAQQLSMISQNMEEQQRLMDAFYEEKHNLVNELTALRGTMTLGDNEEAVRNLDRILDSYHGMGSVAASGNSAIDAIINAKYGIAKEYGISFHLQISVPQDLPIEPCDLGVVVGNALDNAIAAVRECPLTEKVIHISIGIKKNALVMVIKNPYAHELKKDRQGELLSTKTENHRHGYGLRSIRRIAKDYDGDVIIDTEKGTFVLTVILTLREF